MQIFHLKKSIFYTAQKMKFYIKDFFSKCDRMRSFLQILSHLPKKSLMKSFFCAALRYNITNISLLVLTSL